MNYTPCNLHKVIDKYNYFSTFVKPFIKLTVTARSLPAADVSRAPSRAASGAWREPAPTGRPDLKHASPPLQHTDTIHTRMCTLFH